jgi:putative DNA primase/helicase
MNMIAVKTVIENAPIAPVPAETLAEAVTRLSQLSPLEYEKVREAESKTLGVRVSALDSEVTNARRAMMKCNGEAQMFPVVEPWPESVDGATLLHDVHAVVRRFVICEPETAIAATLWIAFTWIVDHVQIAPLAIITAPEKRCGKSQLLNLIGRLCRRPLIASNISSAAVFRVIEAHSPTLLIDEADSFMRDNEELRGVINSGHTRQSAFVVRTVGDDHEPKTFSTWGSKAISGIGKLQDTIMDRAIILELRRKLPHEKVDRLRHAEAGLFERLASRLARWADDAGAAISRARPALPEALHDRAQDNWEPLLAIADAVGDGWGELARKTALKLSGAEGDALSLSAELLADIQQVFAARKTDRIATADLLAELVKDEEGPWASYNRGNAMAARQLAKRLGEYGIKPKNVKFGLSVFKGYLPSDFTDAFTRYLAPPISAPDLSATPLPEAEKIEQSIGCMVVANQRPLNDVDAIRYHNSTANQCGSGIADKKP